METSYPAIGVYGTVDIRSSIFVPRWRVHRFGYNEHFLNLKHFFNCQKHTSLLKTTPRWMVDTLRHLTITLYQHSVGKWPFKKIKAYNLIFALLRSIRVASRPHGSISFPIVFESSFASHTVCKRLNGLFTFEANLKIKVKVEKYTSFRDIRF